MNENGCFLCDFIANILIFRKQASSIFVDGYYKPNTKKNTLKMYPITTKAALAYLILSPHIPPLHPSLS